MRIDEKMRPVEIETEAILAIGMLSWLPPIQRGLMRRTLSGETSIRVGKIRFPPVHRLAVKVRTPPTRGSIGEASGRRIPISSAHDEIDPHGEVDANGLAVHRRGPVAPLAHRIERRFLEDRVRGADDLGGLDAAVQADDRADGDTPTQTRSTRRERVVGLDLRQQHRLVDLRGYEPWTVA